jgi:hypothetical protein
MPRVERTTTLKESGLELEQMNGDPFAVMVKSFLVDGMDPNEDLLRQYDINVKVQKLDRFGKPRHGVVHRSDQLIRGESDIFDEILDDPVLGVGRYNFFVEYRKTDSETAKDKVVVVRDIHVGETPAPYLSSRVENPPGQEEMSPILALLMQNMQESQKTTMALLTSLLTKIGGAGDGGAKSVLDGIKTGIDLVRSTEVSDIEENPEDVDPQEKLFELAVPLLQKLLESKDPNAVLTLEELNRAAEAHGVQLVPRQVAPAGEEPSA